MTHPTNLSSGLKTADGVILDRRGILAGINMTSGGTNDLTVILYDNASAASGTVLFKYVLTAATDGVYVEFPCGGIRCSNGIYADITTVAGGEFVVHYR